MHAHFKHRCTPALGLLALFAFHAPAVGQVVIGSSPYLSVSNIPAGFYLGGLPSFLDDLEDGSLNGSLIASLGSVIGPGTFDGLRDSVDADDGIIDGSGLLGHSWFTGSGSTGVTFTYTGSVLPTAFGLVWTDGGGTITFSAFDSAGVQIFTQNFSGIPDGSSSGTTAEDRFFGVQYAGGIKSIFISNSSGGIEIDHIQYGTMAIPEPETWALLGAGLGLLGFVAHRQKRPEVAAN